MLQGHKLSRFVIVIAVTIFLLLCCDIAEKNNNENKPTIAIVMKSLANDFFITMRQSATAHQREHHDDYGLIVNGIKNENDISGQIHIVENMIAKNVDAIVIAPADSKALIPICTKAIEKGIVIINIDNQLDSEILKEKKHSITFVGPNNRYAAMQVATKLAEKIEKGSEVAILEGIPTAFNSKERVEGFVEAFLDYGMNIVEIKPCDWDITKANTATTAIFRKYPNIRGIACANDTMALGALAAIKALGKVAKNVEIVGFDNITAVNEILKEKRIIATAEQYPDKIVVEGIECALQAIRTGTLQEDRETPVDVKVFKENENNEH